MAPLDTILQAEDAFLSGAKIASLNAGAQGSYADYQNASGDFIEWTVNAPSAGEYELTWRYANGATNRPLSFLVNGTVINNNLAFNGTGSWTSWVNQTQTVSLQAGTNTIRLLANGSSGANFDYLRVKEVVTDTSDPGDSDTDTDPGNTPASNINVALQAEDALLSGVTIASLNSGAQGSYADYQNASGDFIEWTVNAPAAGDYDLSWRYANGATNRPLSLLINSGVVDGDLAFSETGSWSSWANQTKTVSLQEGENKIRLLAKGSSGANFDSLTVTASDTGTGDSGGTDTDTGTDTDPGDTVNDATVNINVELQAEDALLSGVVIASQNSGAQGSYADYQNASGDFIEWTVNVPSAGEYDLTWRYANGSTNRPLSLLVNNGVIDDSVSFTHTGSWSSWNQQTQTVSLQEGENKIRLLANGNSGANFDYLKVTEAGAPASSKLRILPLGDSNTKGEGTPGGYRIQFWERAVNDGVDIDFLGTRNNGPASLGDGDHQGQGGWAIPQMTAWVNAGNLAAQDPDMILFMMGTNDANTNGNVSATAIRDRLSALIDAVHAATPLAHLFVSSILPLDTPRGTATEAAVASAFNALIPDLVTAKAAEGKRVTFINAGGSLSVGDINGDNSSTADQNDGLHATAAGYDLLGDAWYDGVSATSVWQDAVANQTGAGSNALIEADQVTATAVTEPVVGDSGSNVISGGSGFDELTGGGGADTFAYAQPSDGVDIITDFGSDDTLQIMKSGFGGDLVVGSALSSADYILGSNPQALDTGSTFLFNTGSQTLSFDVDGTGSQAAVGIATFSNGFAPQANQIEIIV